MLPPGVTAFLDSYASAFNAQDADAIAAHFALPCILIDGDPILWATPDQVVANMQRLIGLYRESGFRAAGYAIDALLPQGADALVLNLLWTLTRDPRPQWQFRTGYTLRRIDDAWKITFCMAYEERISRASEP